MIYTCWYLNLLEIVNYYCYYKKCEICPLLFNRLFEYVTRVVFEPINDFWYRAVLGECKASEKFASLNLHHSLF
jgi:hypothetical protein